MRVEARQLSKSFGRIAALQDVSFEVASGDRVALIGPNGSGKSTLIRALMGLICFDGEVLLDGRSPGRDRLDLLRKTAYAPQVAPQTKARVRDLIRAVTSVRRIDEAATRAVAAALGLDLGAVEGRPFRALSGGMRQKVLVALALGSEASLLVLDEPTASLDVAARERFFELFDRFANGATLVLCSHRLEEIRHLVDQVVALDEGRVVYDGSASSYLARSAVSVVEVQVDNGSLLPLLSGRGFRRQPGGWWAGVVRHGDKMSLLADLADRMGTDVKNLLVRDLEHVEVSASTAQPDEVEGGADG